MKCPNKMLQNLQKKLEYENPCILFSFSFRATLYFPLMLPWSMSTRAFIRRINKVAQNEKQKNQRWVFVYIKHGKFLRISLELFIKHKPLFSEECVRVITFRIFANTTSTYFFMLLPLCTAKKKIHDHENIMTYT